MDWYAISAEQADALPHVWQKGASAMGGLCGGLGFARGLQIVPVLLPVVRPQFLPRDLAFEMALQGQAVIRREWAKKPCPRPHIAAVWVSKDSGDFRVTVSSQLKHLFICFDLHTEQV